MALWERVCSSSLTERLLLGSLCPATTRQTPYSWLCE